MIILSCVNWGHCTRCHTRPGQNWDWELGLCENRKCQSWRFTCFARNFRNLIFILPYNHNYNHKGQFITGRGLGTPSTMLWKPELYKIQLECPKPQKVLRDASVIEESHPSWYGCEYHGQMSHKESELLLKNRVDGSYLVRQSPPHSRGPEPETFYTLSVRFNRCTKHYKIFYKPNMGHYLAENLKTYDSIDDLVADGLVNYSQ